MVFINSQFFLQVMKGRNAKKNFVLIESSNGVKTSAMIFGLIEAAKANGVNIYGHLEILLTEIPKHQNDKNLDFLNKLLPWSLDVP